MFTKRYLVEIGFKSGVVLKFWCLSFTVTERAGSISKVEWETYNSKILSIDVDQIDYVIQRKVRRWF